MQKGVLLGYVVNEKELYEVINMIDILIAPNIAKRIDELLGHVGCYKKLIPDYAKIALPITKRLEKDIKFELADECQHALNELKARLSTYPVLMLSNWKFPFHVFCDASLVAV